MPPVDLTDLTLFADESFQDALARLRREAPVYWNPTADGGGFWAVTRYDDVVRVLHEAGTFSSEYGNMLRIRERRDPAAGTMVMVTDPPRHSEVRALLNHAVARQPAQEQFQMVDRVVRDLLARAVPGGAIDFAHDVADRLPVEVTCEFLGVPAEDRARLGRLSLETFGAEDPELATGDSSEQTRTNANAEIIEYFHGLSRARRRDPGDDFVSVLITTDIAGGRFSDTDVALNCFGLLLGGNETSRSAAAGGLLTLLEHPEQWAALRAEPRLLPRAIEEIVRWTSPVRQVLRKCVRDTEVGGEQIRAGQVVTAWLVSANRDETKFTDPDRFQVGRNPNRHVGFGTATHRCVGRGVARTELRSLFQGLIELPYDIELAGAPVRVQSPFLSGYKRMPVRLVDAPVRGVG